MLTKHHGVKTRDKKSCETNRQCNRSKMSQVEDPRVGRSGRLLCSRDAKKSGLNKRQLLGGFLCPDLLPHHETCEIKLLAGAERACN